RRRGGPGQTGMATFLAQRIAQAVPVLLLASLVVFSMLHLVPGDPIDSMVGAAGFQVGGIRQEAIDQIRRELGLDQPLPVQYARWLGNALRGDLGQSYVRRRPVTALILERLPSTAELAAASMLIAATL